jgi:hypothetical protein
MAAITAARQRKLERVMHLLTGAMLLAYVYLPAGRELEDIIRFLVLPLLALSGMAMWQARRLRRALKGAGRRAGWTFNPERVDRSDRAAREMDERVTFREQLQQDAGAVC